MKKFFTFALVLISSVCHAQFDDRYQPTQYDELAAATTLLIPNDTILTTSTGTGISICRQIAIKSGSLYRYSCSLNRWVKMLDGGFRALDSLRYDPSTATFYTRYTTGGEVAVQTGLVDSLKRRIDSIWLSNDTLRIRRLQGNIAVKITGLPQANINGLISALASKANNTITISAGSGLTGGGDLSANRTLSANFGNAAGTIAQGNDSRINNGQTAFSWGNHASAGYLTMAAGDARYPLLSGAYANPSWITSLPWTRITSTPATIEGYGISDANLSTILGNGNSAVNNITLGAAGNATSYYLSVNRFLNPTNWTAKLSVDGAGGAVITTSGATAIKTLSLPPAGNEPIYTQDGITPYRIWHENNHPSGSAFNSIISGANVLASLTTNSAGHVTGLTARAMTPADIGAAAATGQAGYIQNRTDQQAANFNISGIGTAGTLQTATLRTTGAVATTGGDIGIFEGGAVSPLNLRWRFIRSGIEGGGNTGNDFNLQSFTNSGTIWANPFSINRSTSVVTMPGGFKAGSGSSITGTGSGVASLSYLGFYEADGTTTRGAIGKQSNSVNDFQISSPNSITFNPSGSSTTSPAMGVASTDVSVLTGSLTLNNTAANMLTFRAGAGLAAPVFNAASAGTKINLFSNATATATNWAIGMETNHMWNAVATAQASVGFKWYGGTTQVSRLDGLGSQEWEGQGRFKGWYTANGSGPAAEIGYNSGHAGFISYDRTLNSYVPLWLSGGGGLAGGTGPNTFTIALDGLGFHLNTHVLSDAVTIDQLGSLRSASNIIADNFIQASGTISSSSNISSPLFKVKEGTNASMGVATFASGTTSVVVATNKITNLSRVFLTINSTNDLASQTTYGIASRIENNSFTIFWTKPSTQSGTIAWQIVEPY